MNLSELKTGQSAVILKINGLGSFNKRLTEMGFVKDQTVTVIKNAPLKDPIEYKLMDYEVSLRRSEAELIEVSLDKIAPEPHMEQPVEVKREVTEKRKSAKQIKVALVGNPNCGKTTLFNLISGLNEHVGNYSGVTIGSKDAEIQFGGYSLVFTDLPGTYSLSEYSPEELFVREHITTDKPDIILNVLDATNLERNLYLTCQLIDIEANLVISLNMFDELQKREDKFDYQTMGTLLSVPIVPTVAKRNRGINELLKTIVERYDQTSESHLGVKINYGLYNEQHIESVIKLIQDENKSLYPTRFFAIKLLEGDALFLNQIKDEKILAAIAKEQAAIKRNYGETAETALADARYGFISGALHETLKKSTNERNKSTRLIDSVLTNQYLSFPIFLGIMWLIFYGTFTLGEYPMMLLENLVGILQSFTKDILPTGAVNDLISDGIIGGVGSVIIFLPNILILFLFISILEDTGYMARTAFIMDKIMHKVGLHGKSFIPLIMGFGCNVPAVMASRIIENRENRILTMLITPFMSCSAKIPVYILILGTFFPNNAGNMLFLIHIAGIIIAAISALILNKFVFKGKDKPFVMELPPYRMPHIKNTFKHMWQKGSQYLQKMGGVILVAVVIIWVLSYYPQSEALQQQQAHNIAKVEQWHTENTIAGAENFKESDIAQINKTKDSLIHNINFKYNTIQQENSYLAQVGKTIEPVVSPLGFDWKIAVCLTAGIAAKEIIVSTMGVINQIDADSEDGSEKLQERLRNETYTTGERIGQKVYNKAVGLSMLMFTLIYFPCIATVTAIHREAGHVKWMIFTVIYTTGLAWIFSFATYNIAKLFI